MLVLHTMLPAFGLSTFTPFGLKLMAYLRLTKLPFEVVTEVDPGRGPKQKFPWLVDGDVTLGDSDFIVRYLRERYGADLDANLDAADSARAHALRRMIEESLCFSILYFRWTDRAACRAATDVALASMPSAVRAVVRPLIRRRILRDLRGQGVGRHRPDEVLALGGADLDVLATTLGNQAFLIGQTPTLLDTSAAAFLAVILYPPLDHPLKRHALQRENLVAYTNRMRDLCWA
jgi:glutathione S-transferase